MLSIKERRQLNLAFEEIDVTFPLDARRRAEDLLIANGHTYHFQVFSGVSHGFAIRGDPEVENERELKTASRVLPTCADRGIGWAKEASADGILRWFHRFSV